MSEGYIGDYHERPTGVLSRGRPIIQDGDEKLIHLRRPRPQKGMKEGLNVYSDYMTTLFCGNGNYHVQFTNDVALVTCEKCLERFKDADSIK